MSRIVIWRIMTLTMGFCKRPDNRLTTRLVFLFFIITFQFHPGFAQNDDFQLWSGVGLDISITKKISFEIEEEIRLKDNAAEVDMYFTDAGISYNFWNNFKLAANYRYIRKYEPEGFYSNMHKYYIDLEYENNIRRWEYSIRTRYQSRYKNINSSEQGFIPENHCRNKISFAYDIYRSPLKPEIGCEIYYQLNNPDGNKIDKLRVAPELNYSINRANRIKIYYMIEKEYSVKNPATNYILGIGYTYRL
jgi:hypothetical protein